MELNKIIEIQENFDSKHGWSSKEIKNIDLLIESLQDDTIGIVGELGEFANILKKIKREQYEDKERYFTERYNDLHEEIVDVFIYLIRIVSTLNIDLEKEYFRKIVFNIERFRKYE